MLSKPFHAVTHFSFASLPLTSLLFPTLQKIGKVNKLVRDVVRDTVGFAPYERRVMELIKGGGSNPTKRAYKFAKNRLGSHIRAKRKVKEMEDAIAKAALKRK